MTGSSLAPVVIPIVTAVALAVWLAMVFYATAHPEWKARSVSPRPHVTGAEDHPEARAQARLERTAAKAAHSTGAPEPDAGEHGQPPPAPPARAA